MINYTAARIAHVICMITILLTVTGFAMMNYFSEYVRYALFVGGIVLVFASEVIYRVYGLQASYTIHRRNKQDYILQTTKCGYCKNDIGKGDYLVIRTCNHIFHLHCLKPENASLGFCPECSTPISDIQLYTTAIVDTTDNTVDTSVDETRPLL